MCLCQSVSIKLTSVCNLVVLITPHTHTHTHPCLTFYSSIFYSFLQTLTLKKLKSFFRHCVSTVGNNFINYVLHASFETNFFFTFGFLLLVCFWMFQFLLLTVKVDFLSSPPPVPFVKFRNLHTMQETHREM